MSYDWQSNCNSFSRKGQPRACTSERDPVAETSGHETMDKPIVRIENWSVVASVVNYGFRKLEQGQRLTGDVMGHTNLRNGSIYTSSILNIDLGNRLVETHNSLYQLGAVNEDYARWMWEQEKARIAA
jgi:hypothetical protein